MENYKVGELFYSIRIINIFGNLSVSILREEVMKINEQSYLIKYNCQTTPTREKIKTFHNSLKKKEIYKTFESLRFKIEDFFNHQEKLYKKQYNEEHLEENYIFNQILYINKFLKENKEVKFRELAVFLQKVGSHKLKELKELTEK